jgi:hypothetical protein
MERVSIVTVKLASSWQKEGGKNASQEEEHPWVVRDFARMIGSLYPH